MLRRFQLYTVRRNVSEHAISNMANLFSNCGRFIPEVLHSFVGRNLSKTSVHLIWEHAYESPEAYERYLAHPYHASVLDRYVLHDSPERITTANLLDSREAGRADNLCRACSRLSPLSLSSVFVGYECARPVYYMDYGVRRLVLIGLRGGISVDIVSTFEDTLRRVPGDVPQVALSVIATNSVGNAWYPSAWSHIWEQGFKTRDDLRSYLEGSSALAKAERFGWTGYMGNIIERSADFYYVLQKPAWLNG